MSSIPTPGPRLAIQTIGVTNPTPAGEMSPERYKHLSLSSKQLSGRREPID
jgi:hypothetical protein